MFYYLIILRAAIICIELISKQFQAANATGEIHTYIQIRVKQKRKCIFK